MSNYKRLFIAFIAVLLITVFSINCSSGDWLDDGEKYLCPECREVYGSELIPCQHCAINPTPYNYCYDCAKELNRCQLCGRSRFFE
ncbi:MAG: hypothetical protein WBB37_06470 [bacterium]